MINENHKYYNHLTGLALKLSCPDKNCVGVEIPAYRFVYDSIKHPDNFLPQAIKALKNNTAPVRRIDDKATCDDYALSLFSSSAAAKNKFKGFSKRTKKLLGYTHIAEGSINKKDGVITPIETSGHFNLHEFQGIKLFGKFKIVDYL